MEDMGSTGILILPVGEIEGYLLEALASRLGEYFRGPVSITGGIGIPQRWYRPDLCQYDAEMMVNDIEELPVACGATRILGITGFDMFSGTHPFVFGMSSDTCAVVSLFRLRPELYGQASSPALLTRRVITEVVHEIGHTYGLPHCTDPRCSMYSSNSIVDTDRKRPDFCPVHRKALESATSR